ncbi:MAG TPA: hypothetical protein VGO08_23810, partial [Burkholderiales bacterium]|nr:hypothetical protein [Burkholderiales bacterium]
MHDKKLNRPALIFCVLVLSAMSLSALAAARVHLYGLDVFGIPLEFALFVDAARYCRPAPPHARRGLD